MASIDLGMVTAYAYAVAGGYTGSEQDFEDLLGNIAIDLEEIENLSVTVTTLPEGSQATASYNNGVLALGIPKGDTGATGAEGPEGPTGPTGNGIQSIAKTGTSGNVDTYTITYTNGQTTTFTVTNGTVTDIQAEDISLVDNHIADLSFMCVTDTATGSIATFPDGSGLDAIATEIQIEPKQAGSGTPSPDNVRKISGWSSVEVESVGKNLCDENVFAQYNATLQSDGTWYSNDISLLFGIAVFTPPNGYTGQLTLLLRRKNEAGKQGIRFYINYTDGTSTRIGQQNATGNLDTYTLVTDASKTVQNVTSDYGSNIPCYFNLMVAKDNTEISYEPYNGIATTINLGQTVYGGTIYPEEGRGLITDEIISSYNGKNLPSTWISDRDVYASGTTPTIGAQVCYELATPIEFTFPAVSIPTLNGTNNIWADSGDIEVEYIANLKDYIDKKINA